MFSPYQFCDGIVIMPVLVWEHASSYR